MGALMREQASLLDLLCRGGDATLVRYGRAALWRHVLQRMRLHAIHDVASYQLFLAGGARARELDALGQALEVSSTAFFADLAALEELRRLLGPQTVHHAPDDAPLRAWVPSCATGEESYTIAMLLLDGGPASSRPTVRIFASDRSATAIARARAGVFDAGAVRDIPLASLHRYFDRLPADAAKTPLGSPASPHARDGPLHRVAAKLRATVVHAEHDVLSDPPFSHVDLICCRHLLRRLSPKARDEVLATFAFSLADGGILMLGRGDDLGETAADFELVSSRYRLYRRAAAARRTYPRLPAWIAPPAPSAPTEGVSAGPVTAIQGELRSTYEQLETHQRRQAQAIGALVERVAQLEGELEERLASSGVAGLWLDDALRIRAFTKAAGTLFHCRSSDIGRPLAELALPFRANLLVDIERVSTDGGTVQRRLRGDDDQWYLCSVRSHRARQGPPGGVVIALTELVDPALADREIEAMQLLRSLAEASPFEVGPGPALETALRLLCSAQGWSIGHAFVQAEGQLGLFVASDSWSVPQELDGAALGQRRSGCGFRAGEGVLGRAVDEGQPLWHGDLAAATAWLPSDVASRLRSAIVVPLVSSDVVLGVLELYAERALGNELGLVETLSAAGTLLGQALQSQRLRAALRRIAALKARAEDEERRRLADGLHDDLGQLLCAIKAKLVAARRGRRRATDLIDLIDDAASMADQAIESTRVLTFRLSPPVLYELGLFAALQWLADDVRARLGLTVEVGGVGGPELSDGARAVLFRGAREALLNVSKHARTERASVVLSRPGTWLVVTVTDDGVGFDPAHTDPRKLAYGLQSIREQLTYLGGSVLIDAAPGAGTRVQLTMPVDA